MDLIFAWTINFLDFVMLYLMVNSLIGNNAKIVVQNLSLKIGIFAIGYGLLVGVGLRNVNSFVFQAIAIVIMFLIIKYIFLKEEKNHDFSDIVLTCILYYLTATLTVAIFFSLINLLVFEYRLVPLITYLKSAFIIFIACWRVDFNKLFTVISNKIVVRFCFFGISTTAIGILAFIHFDSNHIFEHFILFFILINSSLIGLLNALKTNYYFTDTIPNQYHDAGNLMLLLDVKMEKTDDIAELRKISKQIIRLMGMDIKPPINDEEMRGSEAFLLQSIELLKQKKNGNADIITDIEFFEPHKFLNDIDIAYMLGILLENAMETLTKKPIYVNILSSERKILIKVSNEAKEKTQEELDKMLIKNYSTKGKVGRGFGLAKLNKLVNKYHGTIRLTQAYHSKEQVNFLTIVLTI